jgi:tetratricopeptide (TPR) repeat protein
MNAVKMEQKGFTIFAIGAIILFLVPFLSSLEILGTEENFMGAIHIILLAIGILICLVGMVFLARDGGYFSIWLFGTIFLTIFGGHEAFKLIIYTGNYGPIDRFLMMEGIGILLASFVLYIYAELKFVYLAYRIEEAQKLNDEKKYQAALEVLDKVLAVFPNYSTAWNNKGNIYYRLKQYEEAMDCYDRVAFINPDYPHTENNIKQVQKKLKKRKSTA